MKKLSWNSTLKKKKLDRGIQSHHFMTNRRGKVEAVIDFIFLGSKITADSDYSYEIKRCLLFERKTMTNLGSALKSRDITLPTMVHLVMVCPVVMYGCESWTLMKSECQRIDAFKLCCWRRLLRVPWDQTVNPRGNQLYIFIGRTDAEAEAPELWPLDAKGQLFGKDSDTRNDWGQEDTGETEDEMVRLHHRLNRYGFEQTPGDSGR